MKENSDSDLGASGAGSAAAAGAAVVVVPAPNALLAGVVPVPAPNENPKVALAGWSFSESVVAGAAPEADPPGLPIPEPNPKPALRALLPSPPCKAAPNPNDADVGGEPAAPPGELTLAVVELAAAAAVPNPPADVVVENGFAAPPKVNGTGLVVDAGVAAPGAVVVVAAPKLKPLVVAVPLVGAAEVDPKEKGEVVVVVELDPNEKTGFTAAGAADSASVFFSFSASFLVESSALLPFAIPPNCAPKEKPPFGFAVAGSSGFSGLVGGLALCPNRKGEGFAGGLVNLAGASLGAEGGFSSSRFEFVDDDDGFVLDSELALAAATGALAVDEEEDVPKGVVGVEADAGGKENELFSSLVVASALNTNPPAAGFPDDDDDDDDDDAEGAAVGALSLLPAKEKTAGGAGGFFAASSCFSVKSAMGTGLGGLRKMAGISLSSTVGAIDLAAVVVLVVEAESSLAFSVPVSERSAIGTGLGGLRKMAGISCLSPPPVSSDRSAIGTGLGGLRKMAGISSSGTVGANGLLLEGAADVVFD